MVADGWLHLGLNHVSQKQVDSFLEAEMTHHWHRTQSLNHHWKVTHSDDWTLVDSYPYGSGRLAEIVIPKIAF
jgi:hypothetical protein